MKRFLTRGSIVAVGSVFSVLSACYLAYAFSSGVTGQTNKHSLTAGCGAKISGGGGCHGVNSNASVQVTLTGPTVLPVGSAGTYTISVSGATTTGGGCDIAASAGVLGSSSTLLQVLNQELTHVSRIATPFAIDFTYMSNSPGVVTLYANGKTSGGWNWAPDFSVRIGPPPAPSLKLPANGSSSVPTSTTLAWSGVQGSNWTVEVSTSESFLPALLHEEITSDTSFSISNGVLANNTRYYWRVNASDPGGTSGWSQVWSFTTALTGVKETDAPLPTEFALAQNYPNPFNPKTVVSSQLPVASEIKLVVYDMNGREVAVLVNERRDAGTYRDEFSAIGGDGRELASGVYLYRLTAGSFVQSRKMILIK